MTQNFRRFFALAMVVVFVVVAPPLVLYSLGYRFDTSRRAILKTGALLIATTPRGALLALDGRTLKQRTPTVLRNLLPGQHTVRLTRDGYAPWEKKITIVANRTAVFDSLLLVRSSPRLLWERRLTGSQPLQSPDGSRLGWIDPSGHVAFADRDSSAPPRVTEVTATDVMAWSPFGRYLLARSNETGIIMDPLGGQTPWVVPLIFGDASIRWNQANENFFYALTPGGVHEADILSRSVRKLSFNAVDLAARGEMLLTLEHGGLANDQRALVTRRLPNYEREKTEAVAMGTSRFLVDAIDPVVIAGTTSLTLFNHGRKITQDFQDPIRGAAWSAKLGSLVAWTESEVWTIEAETDTHHLLRRAPQGPNRVRWVGGWPALLTLNLSELVFEEIDTRATTYRSVVLTTSGMFRDAVLANTKLTTVSTVDDQIVWQALQPF